MMRLVVICGAQRALKSRDGKGEVARPHLIRGMPRGSPSDHGETLSAALHENPVGQTALSTIDQAIDIDLGERKREVKGKEEGGMKNDAVFAASRTARRWRGGVTLYCMVRCVPYALPQPAESNARYTGTNEP